MPSERSDIAEARGQETLPGFGRHRGLAVVTRLRADAVFYDPAPVSAR